MTESREVWHLRQYMLDSRVSHRVTSTTNHSQLSNAGFVSRHVQLGTDGQGLAADLAGPTPARDSAQLAAIFWSLMKVERHLHELIYAGPQVSYNIRDGKRVTKYAVADHHDHIHVSVDRGVFLQWPEPWPAVDNEWWFDMSIFKDETDKERAYIRDLYLRHLLREPESFEAVEWWRLELHAKGGDAVMAAIADSGEAVHNRERMVATFGIQR